MQIHNSNPTTDTTDDEIEMIPNVYNPQVKITVRLLQPQLDPIPVKILTKSEIDVPRIINQVSDVVMFKGILLSETNQYELLKEGNTCLKHKENLKSGAVLIMRQINSNIQTRQNVDV